MGKHAKKRTKIRSRMTVLAVTTGGLVGGGATVAFAAVPTATEDQWDAIAQCESGGDWSINYSGDGMSVGGLQFQNQSWQAALNYLNSQGYDTSTWAQELYQGMSNVPDKYQTVLAAEALLHLQGPGAWVCTGNGLSASMFDGGPTPAIVAAGGSSVGTPVPAPSPEPTGGTSTPSGGGNPSEVWPDHVHHIVQSGDTLYDITKHYTGDASNDNWRHTYQINKDTVGGDPDLILPGQDIRVDVQNWGGQVTQTDDTKAHSSYVHPCGGYPVGQVFGNPNPNYTLGYHTGVDFSAPAGANAVAIHGGTVVSPDPSSAYGNNVLIHLDDGNYALYAHLSSVTVNVGDTVAPGDLVGYVGSTGNATGPHLHFEIRIAPQFADGNFLDPIQYLADNGLVI